MSDQESNNWDFVISAYTLEQAIEDGVLEKFMPDLWPNLTKGKPILMTAAISQQVSASALIDVWNDYIYWVRHTRDTLPEEEQMFTTEVNGKTIWVIEDGAAFTILKPEDY